MGSWALLLLRLRGPMVTVPCIFEEDKRRVREISSIWLRHSELIAVPDERNSTIVSVKLF